METLRNSTTHVPVTNPRVVVPFRGVQTGCVSSDDPAVVERRPAVQIAGMLLRAGLECRGAPTVTFEYDTREWMTQLQASFKSRQHAQRQCEIDWPRMHVLDGRSYARRAADFLSSPGDLQSYFANQAAFARPYTLLAKTYLPQLVTQDASSPPRLTLRADGTLQLDKTFVVWAVHADGTPSSPRFSVAATIDVGPRACRVSFTPQLMQQRSP